MNFSTLEAMPPSPPTTLQQLARSRIKLWLNTTGTTQTALATHIGKKQAWLSRYLAGDYDADLETLNDIARAFGHTISALLNVPSDPDHARLVDLYNALPADARRTVMTLLEQWGRPPRAIHTKK